MGGVLRGAGDSSGVKGTWGSAGWRRFFSSVRKLALEEKKKSSIHKPLKTGLHWWGVIGLLPCGGHAFCLKKADLPPSGW